MLGLLNFYAPLTDEKQHRFENSEQEERVKAYLKVQGLYYFAVVVLLTVKFYHFQSVLQMERKLQGFEEENKAHFGTKVGEIV